mgnify:FL=1
MDKRHEKRSELLQKLFVLGFESTNIDPEIKNIQLNLPKLDEEIRKHATRYPLEKLAKVDLAVLRLAIYELLVEKKNPPKVIIDEAVTLAREFGNEKSYSFVNGVLGSLLKQI